MKRDDRFLLNMLFASLYGGMILAALYGLGGEPYMYISIIVIVVGGLSRYNWEIRAEGYGARRTGSPLWSLGLALEVLLLPAALGLLFGLLEGWDRTWYGFALGLSIAVARISFELAERIFIRKMLKGPGMSVEQ